MTTRGLLTRHISHIHAEHTLASSLYHVNESELCYIYSFYSLNCISLSSYNQLYTYLSFLFLRSVKGQPKHQPDNTFSTINSC